MKDAEWYDDMMEKFLGCKDGFDIPIIWNQQQYNLNSFEQGFTEIF